MRCLIVLLLVLPAGLSAAVHYTVDVDEDAFAVTCRVAAVDADQAVFQMPATAPGTYQVHDWGRFVSELTAEDAAGAELAVESTGTNTWRIDGARRLAVVRYRVRPSIGADHGPKPIYPMAGTTIEDEAVVYNHFGICGYLRGQEEQPIEVAYTGLAPEWTLAGSLGPERAETGWVARARDYQHLADSPALAGSLATAELEVDDARIAMAAHDPHGAHGLYTADFMRRTFEPVVRATGDWLGGIPSDHYSFLIYAVIDHGGMAGALEHRQSSLYVIPPFMPAVQLRQIGAHEFFHIVTPLNLRTPLVDDFDFADPVPPRHLWFYEGVTEYASHLILRRAGLIDDAALLGAMQMKLHTSRAFDRGISLIELSEGCLDEHNALYMDVYMRGAYTAMALDLELQRLSGDDRHGLRELIVALLETHSPEVPIPADDFFAVIAEHSHPDILPWLERHVAGTELPDWPALVQPVGFTAFVADGRVTLRMHPDPSDEQLARRRRWLEGAPAGAAETEVAE